MSLKKGVNKNCIKKILSSTQLMLAKLGLLATCQIPPKGNTGLDMEKKWNKVLSFYILISRPPSLEAKIDCI